MGMAQAQGEKKECSRCHSPRSIYDFRKDKRYRDGRNPVCDYCLLEHAIPASAPEVEPEPVRVSESEEIRLLRIQNSILEHEVAIREAKLDILRHHAAIGDLRRELGK